MYLEFETITETIIGIDFKTFNILVFSKSKLSNQFQLEISRIRIRTWNHAIQIEFESMFETRTVCIPTPRLLHIEGYKLKEESVHWQVENSL